MGIGPDLGDELIGGVGSEWRCPRCNYPNSGSHCRDCGYSATHHLNRSPLYSEDGVTIRRQVSTCTCHCPVHGPRPKSFRERFDEPLTKKEKKELKKLLDDIKKQTSPDRKVREAHSKKKIKGMKALEKSSPPNTIKKKPARKRNEKARTRTR